MESYQAKIYGEGFKAFVQINLSTKMNHYDHLSTYQDSKIKFHTQTVLKLYIFLEDLLQPYLD